MDYSKFILYFQEYNGKGDSMDIDSWDDRNLCFESEEELKEYIKDKPSYLFRTKAVYRLVNDILYK